MFVASATELGNAVDELFEVDLAIAVTVKEVDDTLNQRILLQVVDLHELFFAQRSRAVDVELLEAFAQPLYFLAVD